MRKGVENLISKNQITLIKASATISEDYSLFADEEKIDCKNLIISSGTEPQNLPNIKRDGEFILNSDDILNLQELPKSILIIGSGAIGIEWSRILNAMGTEVTIIELAPSLLPTADLAVSEFVEKNFKSQKIKFYTNTTIEKIEQLRRAGRDEKNLCPAERTKGQGGGITLPSGKKANASPDGMAPLSLTEGIWPCSGALF